MSSLSPPISEVMPVDRIAMVLILPVLASFVLLWRGLSDGRRLDGRLGELLSALSFGWDELHGLDLNAEEADRLHEAFTHIAAGRADDQRKSTSYPWWRCKGAGV